MKRFMWGLVCLVASAQLAMACGPANEQYAEGLLDVIVEMVTAPLSGLVGFQDPCVPAQRYSRDCRVICVPKRVVQEKSRCYPHVPRRTPRRVTVRTDETLGGYNANCPRVRTVRPRIEKRAFSRQYVQCPECPRCPSARKNYEAPRGPVLEGIVVEVKKQKQPSPPEAKPTTPSQPALQSAMPTPLQSSEKGKKKRKPRKILQCPREGRPMWPYVPHYGGCYR